MIKAIFLTIFFFGLVSCGSVEFVLNENDLENKYKNNTLVILLGKNEEKFSQELFSYFGSQNNGDYILKASFSEKKENRLVKTNQVAEKIDYELTVNYQLYYKNNDCNIFNKKVLTKFSYVPKSFGYNFGSSRSLDKLYNSSIRKNINNFIKSAPKSVACIQ